MLFNIRKIHSALCFFAIILSSITMAQNSIDDIVKKNNFKVTMLSLGSGSTRLTYEHAFNPLNSAEATVGVVGMGWDWMNRSNPTGALLKLAYKWRLLPQRSSASWLGGFYVKPELVAAAFKYDHTAQRTGDEPTTRHLTKQVALLAECGYQLLLGWFVLDVYAGFGPSWGSGNKNNYFHSFMLFPRDGFLAFTAGYRVGISF